MSYSSFVFFFSLIFVACFYSTSSEEVLSTTSFNFLEETTGLPSNWPDTFVSNTTFVNETGIEVPKPDVLPVDTLRGKNVLQVIERLLFQRSFQDLPEPLPSIINFIIRIPVVIIGLILGENVELLGLQALHVGDALLLTGAQGYGKLILIIMSLFIVINLYFSFRIRCQRLRYRFRCFWKDD